MHLIQAIGQKKQEIKQVHDKAHNSKLANWSRNLTGCENFGKNKYIYFLNFRYTLIKIKGK